MCHSARFRGIVQHALLLTGLWSAWPAIAQADQPTLRFLRLVPLGADAGTEVEVEADGAEFDTVDTLVFDHPGLKATFVKPRRFKIEVSADTPEGTYDVWGLGKYGISNPRLFAVSRGLRDIAKKEPNHALSEAQEVGVNVAINGFTDIRGDFYRFHAKQGQRLTFDCFAQRLLTIETRGISAEIALSLLTAEGRLLASNSHYYANDALLDYVFPQDGWYLLQLEELHYAGGKPYRLVISDRPHVETIFPRAVEPEKPCEVTVFGRNLGPGSKPSHWQIDGLPLEEKTWALDAAPAASNPFTFLFQEHPNANAYPVTCSTARLRGRQLRPEWEGGALNTGSVMNAWTTPTTEAEPNDSREQAQPLPTTTLVNGRFDRPGDIDWYQVALAPGEEGKYTVQAYCERLGGRADPFVKIEDEKGTKLIEFDDQSFGYYLDCRNRDPFGQIDLQAKHTYRIMIKDLHGRGGARCQYVLSLRKAETDFYALACAPEINLGGIGNSHGITIRRGGVDFVLVTAVHDGIPCPVTVTADDLPPGLHVAPCLLRATPNSGGAVVVSADLDAADWVGPLHLTATAQVDGQTIRRPVTPATQADGINGGRPTRSLMVAIRDSSPFSLHVVPDKITVVPGDKVPLKLIAVRHWPDCKGRIEIRNTEHSSAPLTIPNQAIAAGETEVSFLAQISPQAKPGEYAVYFQGATPVPLTRESAGTMKTEEITAREPALPLTVTVTATK